MVKERINMPNWGTPVVTQVDKIDIATGKIISSMDGTGNVLSKNIGQVVSDLPKATKSAGKLTGIADDYIKSVAKAISKFHI
jgi:hypothetical protein